MYANFFHYKLNRYKYFTIQNKFSDKFQYNKHLILTKTEFEY